MRETGPAAEKVAEQRRAFLGTILRTSPFKATGPGTALSARQIGLLKDIAARWQGRLPLGTLPDIRVTDACAHHGTCAAVCPTGALRQYADESAAGLEFQAAACIACGVCEMVCPGNALVIAARVPSEGPTDAVVRLSRHALRACQRCDNEFSAALEEELCPSCRKDVGLFTQGFSARSGAT